MHVQACVLTLASLHTPGALHQDTMAQLPVRKKTKKKAKTQPKPSSHLLREAAGIQPGDPSTVSPAQLSQALQGGCPGTRPLTLAPWPLAGGLGMRWVYVHVPAHHQPDISG